MRSVESMRQLSTQLADAERVAMDAEAALASRTEGTTRAHAAREASMLSDTHGRHHNYLRISLTERYHDSSEFLECLIRRYRYCTQGGLTLRTLAEVAHVDENCASRTRDGNLHSLATTK